MVRLTPAQVTEREEWLAEGDAAEKEMCLGRAAMATVNLQVANKVVPGKQLWTEEELGAYCLEQARLIYDRQQNDYIEPHEMRNELFKHGLDFLAAKIIEEDQKGTE